MMAHEYQSAMQMAKVEFESETRVSTLRNDEEGAEMRSSVIGLEMELMRQQQEMQLQQTNASRAAAHALGDMDRHVQKRQDLR